MKPKTQTHDDNFNSLGVAHEAKRLAEYLRHWCEQNTDARPISIDQASRLADSLDHWADDQEQTLDSSAEIVHPLATPSRKRPRATELPSVASLLGQASPARSTPGPAPPASKFSQRESAPKTIHLPRKLSSPRPSIVKTRQTPADDTVSIPASPTPLEAETTPRRKNEPVARPKPTLASFPDSTLAASPTSSDNREIREIIQPPARRSLKREVASPPSPGIHLQRADRSDISIPARWWNIPVAITLLVGIAVAIGGIGVEVIRVAHSQSVVADVLHDPKATSDQIVAAARALRSSPLARWDANRELLTARATLLAMERSSGLSSIDQSTQRENTRVLFRRAADRNPQSPWHRLNVALAAPATLAAGYWEKLAPLASHEPMVAEQSALYRIRAGSRSEGLADIRKAIQSQPSSAGRLARSLLAAGVSINEMMSVIPDSPDAVGGLLTILQTDAVIGLRRAIEERLTQLTLRATKSDGLAWKADDWGDWGKIETRLERWTEAAAKFERAIELDPTHVRYKLLLASVRTEQQNMDEAKRLLSELPVKLSADEESQRRSVLAKLAPTSPTAPPFSRASAN